MNTTTPAHVESRRYPTERANETLAVRAAWHELNDALQAVTDALTAADGLPTGNQIGAIQSAARRFIDTAYDADYARALRRAAIQTEA